MDMLNLPPIICVVGPTASGKTVLAVELAMQFNGEVVSCDSMQIYRGMDIGTAKPTQEERHGVPHHMIDCASPFEPWSAGIYAREAARCIKDIQARNRLPIVCGGTGLWLRALTEGLSDIPAVRVSRSETLEDAYARLQLVDPETAARLSPGDRQRIWRALDVYDATGVPLSVYLLHKPEPRYRAVCLGFRWPREALYGRIQARVWDMLGRGLAAETKAFLDTGLPPECAPLQAIGYRETTAFLQRGGAAAEEERLAEDIALNTRRYAKRQMTWFSHQTEVLWLDPENENFFETGAKFVENSLVV